MIRQVAWSEFPDGIVAPRPPQAGRPVPTDARRVDDVRFRAARAAEPGEGAVLPDRLRRA
jgi:hypothetical protein